MKDLRKKGIILIIIGICIPLFALPFVSGLDMDKGFMDNFYNAGIRISKGTAPAPPDTAGKPSDGTAEKSPFSPDRMRIEKIPFRLFLAPTFILLYIGIVMIDKARSKAKQTREP